MDCAQYIRGYILIVSLTLLSACGGGDDAPPVPPPPVPPVAASTGVFVDGVVEGLHYETPTFSGTTNNAGEYDFLPGETVTFSIGGIVLGSTTAGQGVTRRQYQGKNNRAGWQTLFWDEWRDRGNYLPGRR